MKTGKVSLIALDLDGTLLNSSGVISEVDREAIREATAAGIKVVISTGRPFVGVPVKDVEPLGVQYALTTNGAAVYEIPKKLIFQEALDRDLVLPILRKLLELDVYEDCFVDGDAYGVAEMKDRIDDLHQWPSVIEYIKSTRIFREHALDFFEENQMNVQKVTLNFFKDENGNHKNRDKAEELLSAYPELTVVTGGGGNLEFTKRGITKGAILHVLCDKLNIPIEETMAVGDTQNDLSIMQEAGTAVAMGNSEQCLLDMADMVVATNDEGGVAQAIYTAMERSGLR